MSEDTTPKTFTQEQLDEIVKDRLARHAKKFEDYDALKAKVQQYEAAATTSQSEVETLKSQVAELSAKSAKTEREALVARVARDHGIMDSDDIVLFLTGADEDTLTAQAARLSSRNTAETEAAAKAADEVARANAVVPNEGHMPSTPPASADQMIARALASAMTGDQV